FRSRFRRGENDRQIKMSVCVIRIVCDSLKYFLFGFLRSPFLARGNTQIIASGGTLRIDLDCLSQLGEGVVELGLPIINNSERSAQKLITGRNRQSLFQD